MTAQFRLFAYSLLGGLFTVCFLLAAHPAAAQFSSPMEMHGYAWSDAIGWISFNCDNDAAASCSQYKVEIEPNFDLVGHAWSSNIGWIRFGNGLSGCPSGSCNARINSSRDALEGWARACAATANGACTGGLHAEAGGWDGWISLNRTNHNSGPNYGVSLGNNSDVIDSPTSYAWGGGTVIGWVDFKTVVSDIAYDSPCDPAPYCNADFSEVHSDDQWCETTTTLDICDTLNFEYCTPNPAPDHCETYNIPYTFEAAPPFVRAGGTVELRWNVNPTDAVSCSIVDSAGNVIGPINTAMGMQTSQSATISRKITTFTLSCRPAANGPHIELGEDTVKQVAEINES